MRKRKHFRYVIFAVCMLVGGFLMAYPFFMNQISRERSRVRIETYEEELTGQTEKEIADILEKAQRYNRWLMREQAVLTDPFLAESEQTPETDRTVLDIMGNGQIGYLEIPCISVKLPIYQDTGEEALLKGTGLLEGASLPIGGESTHSIIAGHTGLDSARLFTDLEKMREGDVFSLHILADTLIYQVISVEVVLPERTDGLKIREGKDLCTLLTCTPYGVNTHRLLVTGERVKEYEEANAVKQTNETIQNGILGRRAKRIVLWIIVISAGTLLYCLPWIRTASFEHSSEEKTLRATQASDILREKTDYAAELYRQLSDYNQRLVSEGQEQMYGGSELCRLEQLQDSWKENGFGILEIPKMDVRMALYLGATKEHLAAGAAVMEGTSIPLGEDGVSENTVIAGHRGYRGIPYFRDIEELEAGDFVYLTNPWGKITYRVEYTEIVASDAMEALGIKLGKERITLLTCHPYLSHGKQRYLVYCERVDGSDPGMAGFEASDNAEQTMDSTRKSSSETLIFVEKIVRIAGIGLMLVWIINSLMEIKKRGTVHET